MRISELAEKINLHPETIRRLDRKGIISSKRDVNNWRQYSLETLAKLKKLYAREDEAEKI